MRDFSDDLAALRRRLDEASGYLRVDELRRTQPQLETEASRPDLWDDPDGARKVNRELASVTEDLELFDSLTGRIEDAETLFEMGREEGDDSLEPEIDEAVAELRSSFDELELRS
jgi:peptide chain release factor 2